MLRKVRSHAQGLRLHDALSNSPLTIVYQCIGNVKAAQLEDALRAEVPESQDGLKAVPVSFRVKNSLASATGRADVAAFLQTTNVLVGWELNATGTPSTSITSAGARPVKLAESLTDLVAESTSQASASQQGPRRQPPQRTLATLIKASLGLSSKYPIAPLAGFFHGQRIGLSDLARWSELDDKTVYGELLAQLGSVPYQLVDSISVGDAGISSLLDSQSGPLLALLSSRQQSDPAAAAAAAPGAPGSA
ncbi:hypothetical protein Agub_g9473 [Astrephomene gubernaculifera]|uniref:Uncharacterized protein n=1 Tax=Astrephomene gubernaculifera TaxID=47775 RepID=A0AAD3HNA6_9CHLO|nr:hypothetical protein Agub_g9473 [Astrephomene gubernaculifera]